MLGHDLLAGAAVSSEAVPLQQEIDAATSISDTVTAQRRDAAEGEASVSAQDAAAQQLLHGKYGFAILGGIMPAASGDVTSILSAHPRIHPKKTFTPGQTYLPEVGAFFFNNSHACILAGC